MTRTLLCMVVSCAIAFLAGCATPLTSKGMGHLVEEAIGQLHQDLEQHHTSGQAHSRGSLPIRLAVVEIVTAESVTPDVRRWFFTAADQVADSPRWRASILCVDREFVKPYLVTRGTDTREADTRGTDTPEADGTAWQRLADRDYRRQVVDGVYETGDRVDYFVRGLLSATDDQWLMELQAMDAVDGARFRGKGRLSR